MKQKWMAGMPYLIVFALDFYLLPLLAQETGTAMLLMLCVMPLTALITAVIFGLRRGFCPLLPIAAFLLFLPSVFLYYNASAWVYAPAYAVFVLLGMGIGRAFYGKR